MASRLEQVHERATKRMDAIWKVDEPQRRLNIEDRKFHIVQGAQWDDDWSAQFDNSPRMEVDKTHKEVARIFSDYRNNRVAVDFRPSDEAADDETADTLDGLYRADMARCNGQEADDTAFEEAVGGGLGGFRLRACYEDESDPDNEYQRIVKEPVADADQRMFFGPSIYQDKRDAAYAFLLTPITKEDFEAEYGDKAQTDFKDWPHMTSGFAWVQEDTVWVAEYYEVEQTKTVKVVLTHPVIEDEKVLMDPSEEDLAELELEGWTIDRRREIRRPRVHKYCLSGKEVLKDEGLIAGPHIPLVPVFGKRAVINQVEHAFGHVRKAKDPQRIYNAEVSQLAEIAGSSPIERPIFDPEQVKGLDTQWADANIKRHPYALARVLRNEDGTIAQAGALGTVSPPKVPEALAALIQVSSQDIADIIGANDQAEEVPANTSAQAIELVHTRIDDKNFIYTDNFSKAKAREGEIYLGMAQELYVEQGRRMQAMDQEGGRKYVTLGEASLARDKSQVTLDLSKGKFDVVVDVGPSSKTRRDATVRSLVGIAQVAASAGDQQLAGAAITAAMSMLDGEGLDDLKDWVRKRGVAMGVLKPTDEEKAELAEAAQGQQPDPQTMLAGALSQQALADAEKSKATTVKTLAEVEKTKAQTVELLASIKREDRQQFIDALSADADRLAAHAAGMNGAG